MKDNVDPPYVIGPDGERMTLEDLPAATTRRWVPRRKARVVAAVEGGLITREEAAARYEITDEEYESWRTQLRGYGLRGLRVTRTNEFRRASE